MSLRHLALAAVCAAAFGAPAFADTIRGKVVDEKGPVPIQVAANSRRVLPHNRMIGTYARGRHTADAKPPRFERVNANQLTAIENRLNG